MNFKKRIPFMVLLMACCFAFLPTSNASAKEKVQVTNVNDSVINLVNLGEKEGVEILINEDVANTITQSEKELLISATAEILKDLDTSKPSISNGEIEIYSVVGPKNVIYKHTCSPTGPYLYDVFYNTVYLTREGKVIGQIDYYRCGDQPTTCGYVGAITTVY